MWLRFFKVALSVVVAFHDTPFDFALTLASKRKEFGRHNFFDIVNRSRVIVNANLFCRLWKAVNFFAASNDCDLFEDHRTFLVGVSRRRRKDCLHREFFQLSNEVLSYCFS
jgi:hypothetical protein